MKTRNSRPSCANVDRTASAPAVAGVVERGLSSGPIVVRPRLAVGRTAASRRQRPRWNVVLIDASNTVRPTAERHLLIALLSTEYRRGVFWETAGFLAVWLSGLIGLAICWL